MTATNSDLPDTVNPPGQPRLRRGVGVHARALARMRDRLGAEDVALRGLARLGTDDPSIALLDAWAIVTDTVSFYNERIANEGFLRTATQLSSVRELSRTLGYELRPGVAAQVDLAFTVETAPGAPDVVTVPAATPVQSVPGPGALPQTFETGVALEARGAWNAVPALDARPQTFAGSTSRVWVRGSASVRPGDVVLLIADALADSRVIAHVEAAEPSAEFPGWASLELDRAIELGSPDTVEVLAFRERLRLFGWNAPDPNRLVVRGEGPFGSDEIPNLEPPTWFWLDYEVGNPLEVDGDRQAIRPGSWLVLEGVDDPQAASVVAVTPGGATRYAISGPLTTVTVDALIGYGTGARRDLVLHAVSEALPTAQEPDDSPIAARILVVRPTDPPLPAGRPVILEGTVAATGEEETAFAVIESAVDGGDGVTLTLDRDVPAFSRQGLVVRGNVVTATHGESIEQVLGSADGRAAFATFRPRRAPLTFVRASTPAGARPELTVRVDGVAWSEVPDLAGALPHERVYALRSDEGGAVRVVLGDGTHGARPPSGTENVTASYRVGIGEAGAVPARALSILVRRPLGIREVTNPAAAADWAAAEHIDDARTNAPLRVRTLDRVVSLPDHEDLARGYAGIGPARADLVWDGAVDRVLLTALASEAREPSDALLNDLLATIEAVRDPVSPLTVLAGAVVTFRLEVSLAHDPVYERDAVVAAATDALHAAYGAPFRRFAEPVTAAGVLVVVRGVPGVLACTLPLLYPQQSRSLAVRRRGRLPGFFPPAPVFFPPPPPPPPSDVLQAQPGRWDAGPMAAQLLALADDGVTIGVMTP